MKNVTNRYRVAVTGNREFLYEAKITFTDGSTLTLNDKDDLMGDGISITAGTSGTDSFDIGAAVIGELTMTLNNSTEKFSMYDFFDAQINLKIGLRLEDTAEYLQMGVYYVEEANAEEMTITLSALDKMSWLEKKYSEVASTYPRTLDGIVRDICTHCGIIFSSVSFPGGDRVIQKRPEDGEINCLQMISYVAQVAGCYAVMTGDGTLVFQWYDTSVFEDMEELDGGILKDAATGDTADGGNFTNYNSGSTADGGSFTEQRLYAHIYAMGSLQVATDEITITGIRVAAYEEEDEETEADTEEEQKGFLYGVEGYVLLISENPLITKDMEESVAEELGSKTVGMKIRTFLVSALSDPSIEAGDCAFISDRKGNSYPVYITNTVFKLGGYEEFSCGAQSPARNRADGSMAVTEAVMRARKEIKKQITAYDAAAQQLTGFMTNSFGVFQTQEKQPDGSIIHYMHDKPSLEESGTIWKMTSGAIAVSTNGGKTWNAGVTEEGNMVTKVLSAIGINADWIKAGELAIGGTTDGITMTGERLSFYKNGEEFGYIKSDYGDGETPGINLTSDYGGVLFRINANDKDTAGKLIYSALEILSYEAHKNLYGDTEHYYPVRIGRDGSHLAVIYNPKIVGTAEFSGKIHTEKSISADEGATLSGTVIMKGLSSKSSGTELIVGSDNHVYKSSNSSKRYKDLGKPLTEKDIESLYNITPMWAKYKDNYLGENDERYGIFFPMFIAENVEKYAPLAVDHNEEGQVENWNHRVMIPYMFQMIKSQKEAIDALAKKVNELEERLRGGIANGDPYEKRS